MTTCLTTQHAAQQSALLTTLKALAERTEAQTLEDAVQAQGTEQTIDETAQSKPTQLFDRLTSEFPLHMLILWKTEKKREGGGDIPVCPRD